MRRAGCDLPTCLHCCDPMIVTRPLAAARCACCSVPALQNWPAAPPTAAECAARGEQLCPGAASAASFQAAVSLTEIDLRGVCSCEILRRNGCG
jgi:hypothetical protein